MRPLEGPIVEAALGQRILRLLLRLADYIVDGMVDQRLLTLASLDPIQRHLHMGDGLSPGVLLGRLVELLGEEEVLETDAAELLLHFASIRVDLLVGLLRL